MTHDEFLKRMKELWQCVYQYGGVENVADFFKSKNNNERFEWMEENIKPLIASLGERYSQGNALNIALGFAGIACAIMDIDHHKLGKKLFTILNRRMYEYSSDEPLSNLIMSGKLVGISPYRACLVRLVDKYNRLRNLLRKGGDIQYRVLDTCIDGIAYALFIPILKEKEKEDDER